MRKRPIFEIRRGGLKNTEFIDALPSDPDARTTKEIELLEELAEAAADKGDVEDGLKLLKRAEGLKEGKRSN